jgi:SMC interacting uncharacterized protein involved in chromosome segregation
MPLQALIPFLLLADLAESTPEGISSWLVNGAAIAAMVLLVLNIVQHFKRKPPIEAELEKLLHLMREEVNQLRLETNTQLTDFRRELGGAHLRIDQLTRDLNDKMQRLPGQVVDLLNKTGALTK